MDKKEVLRIIGDIVEWNTGQPLMFFQLGNSGKGYKAGDVVHPSFLKDFKADIEEKLHIKFDGNLNEFGNMHINQLCKLCIAKAAENDKAR